MSIDETALLKGEQAENNFRCGRNCTQAVLLAFEKESGLSEEALMKIGAPFGGGIARMRHVCGAALGLFMLAGLLKSDGSKEKRAEDYALVRKLAEEFEKENGSIICAELLKGVPHTDGTKPEDRTEEYYKRRPCPLLCKSAAEIAAKNLL